MATHQFPRLSTEQIEQYRRDGYIICREFFDGDETALMRRQAESEITGEGVLIKKDTSGNTVSLRMWNTSGDDIYGMFARNERVVRNAELLLKEPIYLYSAKMIMKNAREGGAWEWHQDYGYWYNYGCLLPTMLSCLIAVDAARRENGCLQILKGSHIIGRINHERINEQSMADPERVEVARRHFDLVYLELDPGDTVFFDCNVLHRSDANKSDLRRWNYIASYNTVSNAPYKRVRDYGNYEPLTVVPYRAIREFAGQVVAQARQT
jgi:ectoine hydroxylase-related dioxygenase (phytanoyl-CoA dioxygenase family)